MKCWGCQAETEAKPFCPSCGRIAPRPPGATHFDAFGLPRQFELDASELERRYRELSLKLHPDRFARADPRERRLSLEHTTALNDAFQTLKDPVRRAFYLLKLHGIDLEKEDAGGSPKVPLDFLEEVMELREELHRAREAADVEKAQKMGEEVSAKQRQALATAATALSRAERDPAALEEASHQLTRVRYFGRFLEEVGAIEEEALS